MGEPKPKLVMVSSGPDHDPASDAQPLWRRIGDSPLVYWLIAVVLVIAIAGVGIQSRRVAELTGQVENLEVELTSARAALTAYQARADEIRSSVGDLQFQLDALEELVSRDPLARSGP